MLNVIIAEDEIIERDALKFLLKKYFARQIQVIGEASTGKEAVELTQNLKPDLVFMDIQMPQMNGIEASAKIKELSPSVEIIIVTAYSSFEYAKKAIRIGIVDYLVKPYSVKSLKEVIFRIEDKLKEKVQDNIKLQELSKRVGRLTELSEKELIFNILRNKQVTSQEIGESLSLLDINYKYFYCVVMRFARFVDLATEKKLRDYFKTLSSRVILSASLDTLVIFIFDNEQDAINKSQIHCKKIIEDQVLSEFVGTSYCLSWIKADYQDLIKAYNKCIKTINLQQTNLKKLEDPSFFEKEREFCDYMLSQNLAKAKMLIKDIIFISYRSKENNLAYMIDYISELTSYLFRRITQFTGQVPTEIMKNDFQLKLKGCESIYQLHELTEDFIDHTVKYLESNKKESDNVLIEMAKLYINKHYMRDITLGDLSEYVGLSKSYLSRSFKKYEKINYTEYLTAVRMEKAKLLLAGKNLSVAEVSDAVGYLEPNYFSKVFKKYTGISPTDYK